jgi:hypothetical protein
MLWYEVLQTLQHNQLYIRNQCITVVGKGWQNATQMMAAMHMTVRSLTRKEEGGGL